MKRLAHVGLALAALGTFSSAWPDDVPADLSARVPIPEEVVSGVWMIPGGILPDRQPDGNSVVFEAPAGLIVVDTGRHSRHREAILALARQRGKPIVAIVNTHWHLDHVSGNPGLRTAYPDLRVYASGAIDGALTGFFPSVAKDSAQYLDDPQVPAAMREDIRGDLSTIQRGESLKPDAVITESGRMTLGGRVLQVHLAPDAATAGDLWLYDAQTRVAVLGDLVTLPAPFLDTACPDGWQTALRHVAETPFKVAIPGHGTPMNRPQFFLYRERFEAFMECSRSARSAEDCASHWAEGIQPLLAGDPLEPQRARQMAAYYVRMLRANGGRSKFCNSSSGSH